MPLDADFSTITLSSFRKAGIVTQCTLQDIVFARGWSGAMDYVDCKEKLHDCLFDDRTEEVFMKVRVCTLMWLGESTTIG